MISLIGILSGIVVAFGLLRGKRLDGWTALFLLTTVLTSLMGFLFPYHRLLPPHVLGIITLIVMPIAIYARYARRLVGTRGRTYVVNAMIALYLNDFVLIVQLFEIVPALKVPTQSEVPFKVAQLLALVLFILLTFIAALRFRGEHFRTSLTRTKR
jgi:hypothetical protein